MITCMVEQREQALRTRSRRLGYLVGAGIVLFVTSAGILGWSASGGDRTQASAWLGVMVLVLAGLGAIAAVAAILLNRAAEKTRAERLATTAQLIDAMRGPTGPPSREQAASVSCWYVENPDVGRGESHLAVRNASQLPVSRARIMIHRAGDLLGSLDLGVVPPNVEPKFADLPNDLLEKIAVLRGSRPDLATWTPEVDLLFFDAAGEVWWRTSGGVLKYRVGRGTASETWQEHPGSATLTAAEESDSGTGN